MIIKRQPTQLEETNSDEINMQPLIGYQETTNVTDNN